MALNASPTRTKKRLPQKAKAVLRQRLLIKKNYPQSPKSQPKKPHLRASLQNQRLKKLPKKMPWVTPTQATKNPATKLKWPLDAAGADVVNPNQMVKKV